MHQMATNLNASIMKNSVFLLVLLFTVVSITVHAQVKRNVYSIKIEDRQGHRLKGWIVVLQDSAIRVLVPGRHPVDTLVAVKNIQRLSVRRKGAPGRGMGYGFLAGGGLGTLIGFATYAPPDCNGSFICLDFGPGLSALAGGMTGGLIGSIVGVAGGSTYKKYMIYGDQPSYEAFKTKILNGPKSTIEKQIAITKK
jgi:hypothetical protein